MLVVPVCALALLCLCGLLACCAFCACLVLLQPLTVSRVARCAVLSLLAAGHIGANSIRARRDHVSMSTTTIESACCHCCQAQQLLYCHSTLPYVSVVRRSTAVLLLYCHCCQAQHLLYCHGVIWLLVAVRMHEAPRGHMSAVWNGLEHHARAALLDDMLPRQHC